MSIYLSGLFSPLPEQWGLRGDPVLWSKLASASSETHMPSTATELIGHLEANFFSITGETMVGTSEFFVEGFPREGMSGGYVSREFWIKTAIPLLLSRLAEISEGNQT